MRVDQKWECSVLRFGQFKLRSSAYKQNLSSAVNGYSPCFFTSLPAPHSPHVSTTVCPATYAIAIAAIGQATPYHSFLPAPAAWMRRGLFACAATAVFISYTSLRRLRIRRRRHYYKALAGDSDEIQGRMEHGWRRVFGHPQHMVEHDPGAARRCR